MDHPVRTQVGSSPGSIGDHLLRPIRYINDLPRTLRRRTSTKGDYRPDIDGLRFFAIIIVIIGHFGERYVRFTGPSAANSTILSSVLNLLGHPSLGVLLFFSISGYIISSQFRASRANPLSGRYLGTYFKRRILRIEPPYFLLLLVSYLAVAYVGLRPPQSARFEAGPASIDLSFFASLFYAHGLAFGTMPRLFAPGWSLEVEVQFYVIAPFIFALLGGLRSTKAIFAACAAGFILCNLILLPDVDTLGGLTLKLTLARYGAFFWLGVIAAFLREPIMTAAQSVGPFVGGLVGWLGLAGLLASQSSFLDWEPAYSLLLLQQEAIFAMLASGLFFRGSFRWFCSQPWISLIGGACYSIYLTHLQVLQLGCAALSRLHLLPAGPVDFALQLAILLIAVLGVGLTYYAFIERFFMLPDWPSQIFRRGSKTVRPVP